MATTKLVYANVTDIADWSWDQMDGAEAVHDSDDSADYIDIDFGRTGVRMDFVNRPVDGRFELGDIEDIYSYSAFGPGTTSFLRGAVNCESMEAFYELVASHSEDYTN